MTDIRRTLLWVVFTMSLVLLWDAWQKHTGQPSMFGGPPAVSSSAAPGEVGGGTVGGVGGVGGAGGVVGGLPAPAALPGAPNVPVVPGGVIAGAVAAQNEQITVTTDVVKATFDSLGGSLVRLELLGYRDHNVRDSNVILMGQAGSRLYVAQTGLVTSQPGISLPNHQTLMTVVPAERTLAAGANEILVRFESPTLDGRKLAKTYTFRRGEFTIGVKHEVTNESAAAISPQLYLQLARDGIAPEGESKFYFTFTGPAMFTDANKFKKIDFKDIAKGSVDIDRTADNGWIAMVQHYFASAWLLDGNAQREFRTAFIPAAQGVPEHYTIAMVVPLGDVAPGETRTHEATLFSGPQEEDKLADLATGLDLVKDYGWLTILSKPLFQLLTFLHGFLNNWGWAIVALVVVLKAAFYWLNATAYRSMGKMKAVTPKIMEMRERLKDKPQQMQQEMMKIYREEKVNPLGGCLPILVQMPFFIALYWVLLSSVEMRNAPWIGWINDLSAPDPWFILPVLMTLSSLFQVWLNPTPPDPMQAKLMWILPLAFGFMFFFFPAGLVLYWLTNNLLSIAQQWYINKQLGVLGK